MMWYKIIPIIYRCKIHLIVKHILTLKKYLSNSKTLKPSVSVGGTSWFGVLRCTWGHTLISDSPFGKWAVATYHCATT